MGGGNALGRTPMQIDELSEMVPFGAGSLYRRDKAQACLNQGAAQAKAALQVPSHAAALAQAQAAFQAHAHAYQQLAPPSTPYVGRSDAFGLRYQRVPNA